MKKSELREFLDRPNVPFNTALHKVSEFIMESNNTAIIANYIIAGLKNKKNVKSKDIFSLFYIATKSLVTKTRLCNNMYAEQSLLRSVFINTQFQNIIVNLVRQNYALLPVNTTENTLEAVNTSPLTKEQRLAKQAALMREAKAKKRAERLAKEKGVKSAEKPDGKGVKSAEKPDGKGVKSAEKPVETKQKLEEKQIEAQQKKFTKEELEYIEFLKHIRN